MKKLLLILFLSILNINLFAYDDEDEEKPINSFVPFVDLSYNIPINEFGIKWNNGAGLHGGLFYMLDKSTALSLHGGYSFYNATNDDVNHKYLLSDIPVFAGLNYFFRKSPSEFQWFIGAEFGVHILKKRTQLQQTTNNITTTNTSYQGTSCFGYGPYAGFVMPLYWDFNLICTGKYTFISGSEWIVYDGTPFTVSHISLNAGISIAF
ncbi:MAG: hypothetical protein NT007_08870 [Candidatus Kapabacteria bacterium]|nr:hypothetical protein [Candidatus Kapabacteria bacterium]